MSLEKLVITPKNTTLVDMIDVFGKTTNRLSYLVDLSQHLLNTLKQVPNQDNKDSDSENLQLDLVGQFLLIDERLNILIDNLEYSIVASRDIIGV